jgi:flagellar basal body-associated protein FliL
MKPKTKKSINRIILVTLLVVALAIAFVLYMGGSGFRWFGAKGGELGKTVKEKSEEAGKKADDIKEGMQDAAKGVKQGVEKIKGKD